MRRTRNAELDILSAVSERGTRIRMEREANKTLEDKLNEEVKHLNEMKKIVSMQIANIKEFIPAGEDRDRAISAMKNTIKSKEKEVDFLKEQIANSSSTRGIGSTSTSGTGK